MLTDLIQHLLSTERKDEIRLPSLGYISLDSITAKRQVRETKFLRLHASDLVFLLEARFRRRELVSQGVEIFENTGSPELPQANRHGDHSTRRADFHLSAFGDVIAKLSGETSQHGIPE